MGRKVDCPGCTLPSLIHEQDCAFCSRELRSAQEARDGASEFSDFSARQKQDLEQAHAERLKAMRDWAQYLKDNRLHYVLISAAMYAMAMGCIGFVSARVMDWFRLLLFVLLSLVIGGLLGLVLNLIRGGRYKGALVYFVGYPAGLGLAHFTGIQISFVSLMFGIVLLECFGYLTGLHMELATSDK